MTIPISTRVRRRRSTLLLVVYGASLALVAATALALVAVVSGHLTDTAIASSLRADRSLVGGVVSGFMHPADLTGPVADARAAEIQGEIAALVDRTGDNILHIKVYAPDGRVLFSNRPELRGRQLEVDDELSEAVETRAPAASIVSADVGEAATTDVAPGTQVVEEYLPIEVAGAVPAVFEVYRNAAPILAGVDATRRDVILVTLLAAALLAVLLHLVFRAAQRRLTRQTEELLEASRRDPLTGLLNHGSIVERLGALLETARTAGGAVALALVDIDNFRLVNDTYGHPAGDRALVEVARILGRELSEQSELGRYGPDEFLVVAPPSCAHDLEPAIGRLRERLLEVSLQFGASERLPVTVSAGIAHSPIHGEAATDLLAVATVALGEAKASGGNGVRVAELTPTDLRARERSSFDVLTGLVIAVDTKDRYTKRHSEDVARYALFLADRIGLDPELRRTLEIAGLLHDVGKIGIPDAILRKPGSLTPDEYAIVKQHVALGDAIVRDLPNVDVVRAGVRHHHERWDGAGYLDGLAGEAIPVVARILAVADAFSAMTTSRPYRKALSVEEALRRLDDAAGSQLDPKLVRAFVGGIETAADPPLPGDGGGLARPRLPTRAAGAA